VPPHIGKAEFNHIRQVGWGLVAIIALGGLRFVARAIA
jgi:hypothetical protein